MAFLNINHSIHSFIAIYFSFHLGTGVETSISMCLEVIGWAFAVSYHVQPKTYNTTFCVCVCVCVCVWLKCQPTKRHAKHYHSKHHEPGQCRWNGSRRNRSRCNNQCFSFLFVETLPHGCTSAFVVVFTELHSTVLSPTLTLYTFMYTINSHFLFHFALYSTTSDKMHGAFAVTVVSPSRTW